MKIKKPTRRQLRRLRRKFEKRCLGAHDIYTHVANNPLVIVPKNAIRNYR